MWQQQLKQLADHSFFISLKEDLIHAVFMLEFILMITQQQLQIMMIFCDAIFNDTITISYFRSIG